jgi:hypothetical protein
MSKHTPGPARKPRRHFYRCTYCEAGLVIRETIESFRERRPKFKCMCGSVWYEKKTKKEFEKKGREL